MHHQKPSPVTQQKKQINFLLQTNLYPLNTRATLLYYQYPPNIIISLYHYIIISTSLIIFVTPLKLIQNAPCIQAINLNLNSSHFVTITLYLDFVWLRQLAQIILNQLSIDDQFQVIIQNFLIIQMSTNQDHQSTISEPQNKLNINQKQPSLSLKNHFLFSYFYTPIQELIKDFDKLITFTLDSTKSLTKRIPSLTDVGVFVISKSNYSLSKIQNVLDHLIQFMGGSAPQTKQENRNIINLIQSILSKSLKINSIILKGTFNASTKYILSPKTLMIDFRTLTKTIYFQTIAVTLALRQTMTTTLKQFLKFYRIKIYESKEYVRLLVNDLKDPQKAYQIIQKKLLNFKSMTIKTYRRTMEIVIDKKHYHQNLHNIIQMIIKSIGSVLRVLQQKVNEVVLSGRQLYKKAIGSYKKHKKLLTERELQTGRSDHQKQVVGLSIDKNHHVFSQQQEIENSRKSRKAGRGKVSQNSESKTQK